MGAKVLADGKTKFTVLTTKPANPAAPTAAELNAGIQLADHVLTSDFSFGAVDSDKVAEKALDAAGITVNKNTVPKETQSPFVTSGIRVGTPAVTTRGFKEAEMKTIARLIYLAASDYENKADEIRAEVVSLCAKFPIYE